jgi:predicted nucleic acid-binding protein
VNRVERFIDTGYWIALTDSGDQFHARARALAVSIRPPFVTTDAVLLEVGNALSGTRWRELGIALIDDVRTSSDVVIVPLTTELFDRAVALYRSRRDKEWGLTDCVSFVVMRERGIAEALAADQHFVQAGFRALLREP